MDKIRNGNFTSSEIVALTTRATNKKDFGKPALTYISETNMERRLGRSITDEVNARPLTWGKLLERRAFDLLPLEYTLSSTETDQHPEIEYWVGSKDGGKNENETIVEIKCPMTLKSFCNLVDPIYEGLEGLECMDAIRERHKDGDKYYWQMVSNSIINKSKLVELIVYIPYLSELQAIRDMCNSAGELDLYKVAWINNAHDEELPHLIDGGYYKNINIVRFEVPQKDKDFLTQSVLEAGKLLHPYK